MSVLLSFTKVQISVTPEQMSEILSVAGGHSMLDHEAAQALPLEERVPLAQKS